MQSKVFTVSSNDKVEKVFLLLNFERIRHLPVVDKEKLVGMISDRDLKHALGSLKTRQPVVRNDELTFTLKSRTARTIMHRNVIAISPNADASEAAAIMALREACLVFGGW